MVPRQISREHSSLRPITIEATLKALIRTRTHLPVCRPSTQAIGAFPYYTNTQTHVCVFVHTSHTIFT